MSDYILVPGAGGDAWYWHRVAPLLRDAGHDVVAVGLPAGDEGAGLDDYAAAIVAAIGDREDVVLVAQSMGAFSAPLAAERARVSALLLVAPMIPAPGESVDAWWEATGSGAARRVAEREAGRDPDAAWDPEAVFFHDVPAEVREAAWARGEPVQAERVCVEPWPLDAWPSHIPTRVVLGRHDRLFPYTFARALAIDRLASDGEPDVIDTGHLPALARPDALAAWLRAAA